MLFPSPQPHKRGQRHHKYIFSVHPSVNEAYILCKKEKKNRPDPVLRRLSTVRYGSERGGKNQWGEKTG